MSNEISIPIQPKLGQREKTFSQKMLEIPKILLRAECCNGVNANDCMNNNKTSFGGAMLIIGLVIGSLLTFLIMYYINVDSKPTNQ